jgi:hypothetical protein
MMVALTVLITGAFLQDRIIVRPPQVTCRKRMTIDPVRFRHPGKKFHRPTRGHGNARQPRHPVAVRRSATIRGPGMPFKGRERGLANEANSLYEAIAES